MIEKFIFDNFLKEYGVLGVVVFAIILVMWKNKELFLSKKVNVEEPKKETEESPCCKDIRKIVHSIEEKQKMQNSKLEEHLEISGQRVLDFAQFHAAQLEINKSVTRSIERSEQNEHKIFDLIGEIKNMLIENSK